MKRPSIPLLFFASLFIGCTDATVDDYIKYFWPGKNDTILFEIKERSNKEEFVAQIDKADGLTDEEKQIIKHCPLVEYPLFRLAKWQRGKKTIISLDQFMIRSSGHDSKTGEPWQLRSGNMHVMIKSEGKWGGGYICDYD